MVIKGLLFPASILAGTVVGAGFFALPFVFQASGLWTGLFYLALFTIFLIISYLIYGDIVVRTPGEHRFVGYAQMYLGSWGYWMTIVWGLVPLLFALTVYLILAPSFSQLFADGNFTAHLLVFWALGSIAVLMNTRRIALIEFLIVIGVVAIIFLIFGLGIGKLAISGVKWPSLNFWDLAVIGPVLFAIAGDSAVPEMISYLKESKLPLSLFRNSLILGMLAPAVLFLAFVLGVLGLSPLPSEDAVSGLVGLIPGPVLAGIGILGLISLLSSYVVLGLSARRVFLYDLKWPAWLSGAMVVILPPAFYFMGFQSFISLVSNIGGIFIPFGGALGIWMWHRANKQLSAPPVFVGKYIRASMPFLFIIFLAVTVYFLAFNSYH